MFLENENVILVIFMMVLTHLSMFHRESAKTQTILASNVHCQLSHGYPIGYGPIESCKKKSVQITNRS